MTIGSNVLAILQILRGWGTPSSVIAGFQAELDAVKAGIADIKILLGVPETGSFNPKDSTMSVLQMMVGDPPHSSALTFSEPGAPADGAVVSDNTAVATVALAPDMITWTATAIAPGVANVTYTGTSDPPDVGPVVVEPLVLTVILPPAAETGQFNP